MEPVLVFIVWSMICFIFGGLVAASDPSDYRRGVEDAWSYITEPFDKKHEEAARILRGRPLPPIPEEKP